MRLKLGGGQAYGCSGSVEKKILVMNLKGLDAKTN
jgi:hypothetical protein